ncbi:hypothetical protein V7S43_015387 [Phytophthora oleae]|uniref:Uncharacterized protein n=1 Tax=Phytophthora oleae TaxID=2107226 RepID=A0ABD3EYS7_9STRA
MSLLCACSGDLETAEQHFKQVIKVYDQVKGKLSLSPEAPNKRSDLSKLEEVIIDVLFHYTLLLTTLQRPDDAARARQRLTTIVRGSPKLRTQEKRINL